MQCWGAYQKRMKKNGRFNIVLGEWGPYVNNPTLSVPTVLTMIVGFSEDDCEEFMSGDNYPGPYWPVFKMLDRYREQLNDNDAIRPFDENLYKKNRRVGPWMTVKFLAL